MPAGFTFQDDSSVTSNLQFMGTIVDQTLTPIMPAVLPGVSGAGIRNYLVQVNVQNTNGVSGMLNILDGTTVIHALQLPGSMSLPFVLSFHMPLRGGAGNAINMQMSVTGMNVIWNSQGFSGSF